MAAILFDQFQLEQYVEERYGKALLTDLISITVESATGELSVLTLRVIVRPDRKIRRLET
jgi:hypothetical protein